MGLGRGQRRGFGVNYRKLYVATAVSNLGDGMASIAYPWLASAVTRNPLLIALIGAAQRLPWLFFTLPAGVITDRVDRKRAMVAMDVIRGAVTVAVAVGVLSQQGVLPTPDALDDVVGTRTGLYLLVVAATLLMGCAEVLRDNSGQTLMPSIVAEENLEKANGRMWSMESVANTFVGPPLGSLLLVVAFSLPFFLDAASFFASAALVALISGTFRAAPDPSATVDQPSNWRADLRAGVTWLWGHHLLRDMAIILGVMNMASYVSGGIFVLFAQDVLGVSPLVFTIMGFGWAFGGILGGYAGPWMSQRFGAGPCLSLTLAAAAIAPLCVGLSSWWPLTMIFFGVFTLLGSSWNVITVSFRQSIIPAHLLGRVNSVYRFFAWGMMPIGAALGGLTVTVAQNLTDRATALRIAFFLEAAIMAVTFLLGRSRLTTERLEAARAAA